MLTTRSRSSARFAGLVMVLATGPVAGCGTGHHMSGADHPTSSAANSDHTGMPGMDDTPTGDGLATSANGFRLVPSAGTLIAGQPGAIRFQIVGPDGKPVTAFAPDQTKLVHFYLIRSDLTGFQHVHPEMGDDLTWSASAAPTAPGAYRMYASFIAVNAAGRNVPLVLSDTFTVAGADDAAPLPPASSTVEVDGYTLSVAGHTMANMAGTLTVAVAKDGKPVTDLQPYLDAYAHLTAFHEGDLAFTHLHPQGTTNSGHGGPSLSFHTTFQKPGHWRMYMQFQTGGTLHMAAVTLNVS
jgi:hypothetical protein